MEELAVGPAEFTRLLLRRGEASRVALPLQRVAAPGGAARVRWIADALRKDALGWLTRQGGWRTRQVVVNERRREGRLWDEKIFPRLGVRFTSGPLHLLVAAMESRDPVPRLTDALRAQISAGVGGEDPATGDLLALHRLVSSLAGANAKVRPRTRGGPLRCPECDQPLAKLRAPGKKTPTQVPSECPECGADLEALAQQASGPRASDPRLLQQLTALSPLSLAFDPELAGRLTHGASSRAEAVTQAAQRLAPLFRGERAVLLSYLDEAIARTWLRRERLRRRMSAQEAQESYRATVVGLEGYLLAAEGHPDALRPLIAFFEGYVVHHFGGRAPVHGELTKQSQAFDRASEREQFMHSAAALFALGQRITAAVEAALAAAFVDRTERQKVLLADYHTRFRDIGPEVEAIRRELVGEIG